MTKLAPSSPPTKPPKQAAIWWLPLVIAGLVAWQSWAWWTRETAPVASNVNNPKTVLVNIPPGTSAQAIGEKLRQAGLIRSVVAWDVWTRWHSKIRSGGFQAGTYQLSPATSLNEIATTIWEGKVTTQTYTILEGWSMQQMATYFETQGWFSAQEFLAAAANFPIAEFPWLPKVAASLPQLEGYLFPDTYEIAESPTRPDAVIRQMLTRFEQVALPLYKQKPTNIRLSLAEWVSLASIVEKESVVERERPRIAGVFHNRLKQGIPLGADPTVEYGLGVRQTADRTLTLAQVRTPSPYNTYLNPGLPPTPIASPGSASLKATLNPEKTDYLYFVARYDGTHIFSRTLQEHEAAQNAIHNSREGNQKQ